MNYGWIGPSDRYSEGLLFTENEVPMKKYLHTLLLAIIAGWCISLGGTVFLRLKDAFPGGNVIGAVLFTIGLFTICTRGYALFTGKACYIFDNKPDYLISLFTVWVGNIIGTCSFAILERMTVICGDTGIDAAARALVEAKLNSPAISLFILGFFCNIFIFIAVNGYANNPHETGKYLALFLGVTCFILCGTEHSVADMYYFGLSGYLFEMPGKSLLCLFIVSMGNIAGGVLFPQSEKLIRNSGK